MAGDFRRLWAADAVSQVGSRIGHLAVPLLVILAIGATPFEATLVKTAQTMAYLLFGLQVGVWVDRLRCRPVMVVADLGRFAVYASIPLAAALDVLTLAHVLTAVFVAGLLTVFFDVAAATYLPRVTDDLVRGNAALKRNQSVAALVAPGLGGLVVQRVGAPVAVLADALTYLWSALWLRSIRTVEPVRPSRRRRLRREVAEGARAVWADPVLRAIGLHSAVLSLFLNMNLAVMIVFLADGLGLSPGLIGLLGSVGLVGAVAGSFAVPRLAARLGYRRLLVAGVIVEGLAYLLFPLTDPGWRLGFQVAGGLLASFSVVVVTVVQSTLQQARTPPNLLGRVNATMTVLFWGPAPIGSLAGGVCVAMLGYRPTLWIAGAGALLATICIAPLRTVLPENRVTAPDDRR
ncbi:MFS transporter [Actinokineospora sp. UTMC 2448]|uniref:MFS transporter n=1 Tax=Actinokineospora sp. UTMC 2448 TaxID=2268449 RepID=UPI00216432FE|nr:MFS transporter [Actinokineospora sp. UTMC 2448]UVS76971.1 enterobactin exporter EntS [Actinokineospora sp. UTMC 2448]